MRLVAILLALIVAQLSVSAGAEEAQLAEGQALFEANCRRCHGPAADAGQAGDIRGLPASVVARATRGLEEMPEIELSEAELAAIVAYLERLVGG